MCTVSGYFTFPHGFSITNWHVTYTLWLKLYMIDMSQGHNHSTACWGTTVAEEACYHSQWEHEIRSAAFGKPCCRKLISTIAGLPHGQYYMYHNQRSRPQLRPEGSLRRCIFKTGFSRLDLHTSQLANLIQHELMPTLLRSFWKQLLLVPASEMLVITLTCLCTLVNSSFRGCCMRWKR